MAQEVSATLSTVYKLKVTSEKQCQSINDAEWTCLLDRRSSLHYSYNSLATNMSTVRNTRTD